MKIKLAENIKTFRKEAKMTQERLAEAMGVSVGAVYKWESGQSIPDIRSILKLADLFRTSTDVLLGYVWEDQNLSATLERIAALEQEDHHQAATEVEKALLRFPNNFSIVYGAGLLYLKPGKWADERGAIGRAIELLHHACELLDQNQDGSISEGSIQIMIADGYLRLGNPAATLRILKKYNVCGVSDGKIGLVLADCFHDMKAAEPYLQKAFSKLIQEIDDIMIGYANIFYQRKEYQTVIDCFRWLRVILRGIQPEEALTWFDKRDCILLECMAESYCMMGDLQQARRCLQEAVDKAKRYDGAEPQDMKFFTVLGLTDLPHYWGDGGSALECLRRRIWPNDEIPGLRALWQEIGGTEHETV